MAEEHDKGDILIVDDKADQLLAFAVVLGELGVNVVQAVSGREALRYVLKREFAVILLDINMPGMDGFETAEMIRQYRGSRHTPIIFLTATGDDIHRERGYSIGAVDYILTPVIPEVLKTKVGVFVELFRKTEQVKRHADSLRRRAEQLQELTRASLAINSARSLDVILQAVTEAARSILGAHHAMTTILTEPAPERARSVVSVSEKYAAWRDHRAQVGQAGGGVYALACDEGGPVRMTQTELSLRPAWRAATEQPGMPPVRGFLAAPVTGTDGSTIGLLELTDKVEGEFSEDDEAIAVQLAQIGSIAIQNILLAEAREANRLKDEFLATLSHELRTPLNAILGWTRILRSGPLDQGKAARGLQVIERNVNAQVKLIDELLDISRITTGKLRINTNRLSLAPVVEAAIDALRPAAEARGVALGASLDRDAGEVLGDADRLQQVISNVLGNAIKFTPRGGRIDVGLGRAAEGVALTVRDTGDGISAEFLPLIFERFRQADSTSTRTQGGLGIGLAVVRHIVELHGGSVRASSPGRGLGSTFVIELPDLRDGIRITPPPMPPPSPLPAQIVIGPKAEGAPQVTPPDGAGALEGLCVLVVEDEEDARELLKEVLSSRGALVTAVGSVADAFEAIQASLPQVLVSDLAMPGEDGYTLIRRLRERSPEEGGRIPAMALTAYARNEDRVRALAAGFQMHASKPIEPEALVAAVSRLARGEAAAAGSAPRPAPPMVAAAARAMESPSPGQ